MNTESAIEGGVTGAATMTILGMVTALKLLPNIPKEFLGVLNDMLSFKFVAIKRLQYGKLRCFKNRQF